MRAFDRIIYGKIAPCFKHCLPFTGFGLWNYFEISCKAKTHEKKRKKLNEWIVCRKIYTLPNCEYITNNNKNSAQPFWRIAQWFDTDWHYWNCHFFCEHCHNLRIQIHLTSANCSIFLRIKTWVLFFSFIWIENQMKKTNQTLF